MGFFRLIQHSTIFQMLSQNSGRVIFSILVGFLEMIGAYGPQSSHAPRGALGPFFRAHPPLLPVSFPATDSGSRVNPTERLRLTSRFYLDYPAKNSEAHVKPNRPRTTKTKQTISRRRRRRRRFFQWVQCWFQIGSILNENGISQVFLKV